MLRQAFARFLQLTVPRKKNRSGFSGKLCTIAILAQEKLGDSILLTPLLKNLRAKYPCLEIHIITFSRASFNFFRCDPNVTAVHQAKRYPLRYFRNVLSKEFDLLFNTKDHPSTHFLLQTALIRARYKVGHASPFHERLYDHLVTMDFHTHMALKNCSLLGVLGIPLPEEQCRPLLPPMPVSFAMKKFLQESDRGIAIGINLSAGEPNRTWQEKQWVELLEKLPDERFIVLSGSEDRPEKLRIERRYGHVIPSPSTENIYEAGLIIASLKLLITPDTSLIHVASGSGTPVVGLYREAPQDISRFGPFHIPHELVISPSGEVGGIDPETVKAAMKRLLAHS